MSSVLQRPAAPTHEPQLRAPTHVRRIGYVIAAAANVVLLWVAHQLLDWGWPAFLTEGFEEVLGLVTASFIASIVVNLALAVHHGARFRALTDIVTAAFAMAVGLRLWDVFPFDFTGYETDWSPYLHVGFIVVIAAIGIAIVVNLVKLVACSADDT